MVSASEAALEAPFAAPPMPHRHRVTHRPTYGYLREIAAGVRGEPQSGKSCQADAASTRL